VLEQTEPVDALLKPVNLVPTPSKNWSISTAKPQSPLHLHVHVFSFVVVEEFVNVVVGDRVPRVCEGHDVVEPADASHLIAEMDCLGTFVVLPHRPLMRQG
jgi:hypothetical protein